MRFYINVIHINKHEILPSKIDVPQFETIRLERNYQVQCFLHVHKKYTLNETRSIIIHKIHVIIVNIFSTAAF